MFERSEFNLIEIGIPYLCSVERPLRRCFITDLPYNVCLMHNHMVLNCIFKIYSNVVVKVSKETSSLSEALGYFKLEIAVNITAKRFISLRVLNATLHPYGCIKDARVGRTNLQHPGA